MANLNQAVFENGVITMPRCGIEINPRGTGHEYFTKMTKNKDKIFQIDAITGEKDTYGAVLKRCVRTALKMQSLGVTPDDIITTCSLNSLNSCVPYIATFFLGGIVANLDPLIAFTDSVHLMKMINPKMIFVEENSVGHVEKLLEATGKTSNIVVFGHTDKYLSFSEFLETSQDEQTFVPINVDLSKTAIVLFSSGSTGLPKGICLSHRAHLREVTVQLQLETSYDLILIFSRLYWSTAILFMGVTILGGTSKLIIPKFDVELVWEVIRRYKAKFMFASPFQIATLCSNQNVVINDVNSLEVLYIAGGVVFEHQLSLYRKLFPNAIVKIGYGLTEIGVTTYCVTQTEKQLEFYKTKMKTMGSALNGISYKVVAVGSQEALGPYSQGELLLKTEGQLIGYHNLDSSEVWDADGWFKTGDIVYYDEDFYFYYMTRLKEVIKYQTLHVVPKFIENVLSAHPEVISVCVLGILHEIDGEHPMALVQLKDSCKSENIEDELFDYVAANLEDKYKLRGGVKIIKEFPLTASGKVDLCELRRLVRSDNI